MAVIRDVMPAFDLLQPTPWRKLGPSRTARPDAWVIAGGLDSFDWFKIALRSRRQWSI